MEQLNLIYFDALFFSYDSGTKLQMHASLNVKYLETGNNKNYRYTPVSP